MDEKLSSYEKTIKTKPVFSWSPKYREEFKAQVNLTIFIAIAEKAIKRLGWDLIYKGENIVEAKTRRKSLGFETWSELITISYDAENVSVQSETLTKAMYDWGDNSKRVKLFIFAFEDILNSFDEISLNEFEKQVEKQNNWDDYVIPDTLPKPFSIKTPNFSVMIVGSCFLSLVLGFVWGWIMVNRGYVFGVFELLAPTFIAFAMKYLLKLSNYADFSKLKYLFLGTIILMFGVSLYFQWELLEDNSLKRLYFGEFMTEKFFSGLEIGGFNTGWIGLLISWLLQIALATTILFVQMVYNITLYLSTRVPNEVIDFAFFHFLKGKSEEEVRNELSKKGWLDTQSQDEVFIAIANLPSEMELRRGK